MFLSDKFNFGEKKSLVCICDFICLEYSIKMNTLKVNANPSRCREQNYMDAKNIIPKQPRLSSSRVMMGMTSKERIVSTKLIPTH